MRSHLKQPPHRFPLRGHSECVSAFQEFPLLWDHRPAELLPRPRLLYAGCWWMLDGYGSIPINTIFRGMNIHLPAILMFTRGTRFWHTAGSVGGFSRCGDANQAKLTKRSALEDWCMLMSCRFVFNCFQDCQWVPFVNQEMLKEIEPIAWCWEIWSGQKDCPCTPIFNEICKCRCRKKYEGKRGEWFKTTSQTSGHFSFSNQSKLFFPEERIVTRF